MLESEVYVWNIPATFEFLESPVLLVDARDCDTCPSKKLSNGGDSKKFEVRISAKHHDRSALIQFYG